MVIATNKKCPICNSTLYQTETVPFLELICLKCKKVIEKDYNKPIPAEIMDRIIERIENINFNPSRRYQ